MATTCLDSKLLSFGGTSQAQRILQSLMATYAQVDERDAADLILFARNYGAYLNYYNSNNNIDGDWQPFMNNDPAIIIAGIANWRTKKFIPYVDYVTDALQKETDTAEAQNLFKSLFDFVFTLATQLDNDLNKLGDDIDYKNYLGIAIASNIALPLNALWWYYKNQFKTFNAADGNIINESVDYIDPTVPVDNIVFSENFKADILNRFPWYVSSFTPPDITLDNTLTAIENINIIITHNLFVGALQSFINGVIKIVSETPAYLNDVIENYAQHQPHYALYLTFIRLFKFAQQNLNNYTANHLNFYYKTVLQLSNADAIPDYVHLLFDLQKNSTDHLLKKGTAFKAGKDATGNELFYNLTDDVVLHQATVQSLKSLYLKKANGIGTLYAFPVANSDDGNAAKLQSADKSWYAFGDPLKINSGAIDTANIGFAIASNILFLSEGNRTINITFQCANINSVTTADLSNIFTVQFTGKKNWLTASGYTPSVSGNSFTLKVVLDGDDSPIIPYTQKIHGGNFTQQLPMVQVLLNSFQSYLEIKALTIKSIQLQVTATVKNLSLQNDDGKINAAKPFKAFGEFPQYGASVIIGSNEIFQKPLTHIELMIAWQDVPDTKVSASIKALKQGNWNSVDSSFSLNTSNIAIQPTTNTSTMANSATSTAQYAQTQYAQSQYAHTQSAFNSTNSSSAKENTPALKMVSNKESMVEEDAFETVEYNAFNDVEVVGYNSYLQQSAATPVVVWMNAFGTPVAIGGLEKIPVSETDFTANEDYSITSTDGFIKLELDSNDYSLSAYLSSVQSAIKNTSTTIVSKPPDADGSTTSTYTVTPPASVPVPPAPVINSISINYTAFETIAFAETKNNFAARTKFFYHIEPFGFREMHPLLSVDGLNFLPIFNVDKSNSVDGGELWIGLNNAATAETYTILFEVADGTSDPLTPMTEVKWYYLSANNWMQFDKADVSDATNNFTRSGIVTINILNETVIATTRADKNLLWIKAVVDHNTLAVCKLIQVATNAAKAVFAQDVSRNIIYIKSLSPNTISKAAIADAAIKKVNQPFASYDGRIKETDSQFSIRVSERLRHKRRAVTYWDYERLILQNYPQIHKVKCINHTALITDNSNNKKYSEIYPGHVTIVTIPDLTNNTAANPLRPYTSVGLLTEIQLYLQKLNSGFVKLHVINPQFEEVQFEFSVAFMPDHDETFYTSQLNIDIEKFLTPWAYNNNTDIDFGGSIQKSVVLNFIEELDYVDYVTFFKMNQIVSRDGLMIIEKFTDIETAVATTAMSVLVSYNDGKTRHIITPANTYCNG